MSFQLSESLHTLISSLESSSDNYFITGNAGTGKSTLLKHFREQSQKNVAVVAPTGVAAVNVSGETIHSFFKFAPNVNPALAAAEAKNTRQPKLYQSLDTLIIDEISMVRADLVDAIDQYLRTVRHSTLPFGGVQIIMFGDLFQLPPVVTDVEKPMIQQNYDTPFFFSSQVIKNLDQNILTRLHVVKLDKIHRQTDEKFINLLNRIRNSQTTEDDLYQINRQLLSDGEYSNKHIILTAVNAQADLINQKRLSEIPGNLSVYRSVVSGDFNQNASPAPSEVILKTGARVMLLNNDPDDRWINGTLGTAYSINSTQVTVKLDDGETVNVSPVTWTSYKNVINPETGKLELKESGSVKQMPLKLAWAITIHKSQGKTFEDVIIDFGRGAFAHGQAYVALSRCTRLSGIKLIRPLQTSDIIFDPRVSQFFSQSQSDVMTIE